MWLGEAVRKEETQAKFTRPPNQPEMTTGTKSGDFAKKMLMGNLKEKWPARELC